MSQKNEIPAHKDKLGRLIQVDDFVCYPDGNSLQIGKVIKINPKMIKVNRIPDKRYRYTSDVNKYPFDCVLIDGKDATMFILRNSA